MREGPIITFKYAGAFSVLSEVNDGEEGDKIFCSTIYNSCFLPEVNVVQVS